VIKILKIRDDVNLKELEKFGFKEFNNGYSRKYQSDFETFINKITREVFDIEITEKQLIIQKEVKRANDLIKADLVEKSGGLDG
jgi:hypothetical protein